MAIDDTLSSYRLMGRITNPEGKPLEGLTVLAYDLDRSSLKDFLREALTDDSVRDRVTSSQPRLGKHAIWIVRVAWISRSTC